MCEADCRKFPLLKIELELISTLKSYLDLQRTRFVTQGLASSINPDVASLVEFALVQAQVVGQCLNKS